MRKLKIKSLVLLALYLFTVSISSCGKKATISTEDKDALLFMYEEEKLARDTYTFLDDKWGIVQFANIKGSEQKHMDAIKNVMEEYGIEYKTLEAGKFSYKKLQDLYNQFVIDGVISSAHALQIGATVEDLDIVDLLNFENASDNNDVISVFSKLRCGSRNHIRKFVETITTDGDTYTPQFLSADDYTSITTAEMEQCGK